MKYIKIGIILVFLLFAPHIHARSIETAGEIKVEWLDLRSQKYTCGDETLFWGCFVTPNTIWLDKSLTGLELTYVWYHELGHYFLQDEDLSFFKDFANAKESSATYFAMWLMGYKMLPEYTNFFLQVLMGKTQNQSNVK